MEEPQKGVRELAAELNISKSSVQRILITLASEGFIKKNEETRKYELGVSSLELSSIILANMELHTESLPAIENLAKRSQLTSHLAILENLEVVYICKVEGQHSINLPSYTGHHNYSHCTSSGKLLLAHSDPSFQEILIERGLTQFTSSTITDPSLFRAELDRIYKQGYSISHEEFRQGVNSISAPVKDHTGRVVAAVNIVGSKNQLSSHKIEVLKKELMLTGASISNNLGYRER